MMGKDKRPAAEVLEEGITIAARHAQKARAATKPHYRVILSSPQASREEAERTGRVIHEALIRRAGQFHREAVNREADNIGQFKGFLPLAYYRNVLESAAMAIAIEEIKVPV